MLLFLTSGLYSQVINTTFPSKNAYPASTVVMPVLVGDFNGVASISQLFTYDNTVLNYQGFQNVNPALSSGLLINVMASGNQDQVLVSWYSLSPINLGSDTLMEFSFTYNGGTTTVNWDTLNSGNCQYTNLNEDVMPALFVNGSVSPILPNSTVLPVITAIPGSSIQIPVTVASFNNIADIQLKMDYDPTVLTYIGYQSANPTLSSGPLSITANAGSILTTWAASSVISLGDDTLYVLQFTYLGGTTALSWDTLSSGACQYLGAASLLLPSTFYNGNVSSSVIQLQVPTTSFCNGNDIVVPVTVGNCNGIKSFSLTLNLVDSLIDYSGYESLNPGLTNGFVIQQSLNAITLSWTDTALVNLGSALICNLKFTAHTSSGGFSDLIWNNSASNFENSTGQSIPVNFIGGSITINPYLNLGADIEVCKYHSASLFAGGAFASYLWSTGEITPGIQVDSTKGSGYYSVTVTDVNGCTGNDSIHVNFAPCVGIDDISANEINLQVFPNPSSNGTVSILATAAGNNDYLEITDLSGRKIYAANSNTLKKEISLNGLAKGVYLLHLYSGSGFLSRKLVVQ